MSGATLEQFAKPELIDHIRNAKTDDLPLPVAAELPDWVIEKLRQSMSDADILALGRALQQQAPMDVRVNAHKASRDDVLSQLQAEGLAVEATRIRRGASASRNTRRSTAIPCLSTVAWKCRTRVASCWPCCSARGAARWCAIFAPAPAARRSPSAR